MKFIRFAPEGEYKKLCMGALAEKDLISEDGAFYGILTENGDAELLYENYMDSVEKTGVTVPAENFRLLPPAIPGKILAVGLNYYDHIKEFGDRPVPTYPTLFMKMPQNMIGQHDAIIGHKGTKEVHYEGEMALLISKDCDNVPEEEALDCIFGATCLNDVTARDLQRADGQWIRGKNLPTFCPVGPCIVTDIDYGNLKIQTRINGKIVQNGTTADMIFPPAKLISMISEYIPLKKGDLITTGTPVGVSALHRGDVIEIELENVGILRNIFKDAE